jgi:RNA polymerase sigma-70 factor (ECF subfamily)
MLSDPGPKRVLDKISTHWPIVHDPAQFVLCYEPAIRRYLSALIKDPHDAEDVAQDFLLKVLRHGFVHVKAQGGRFRDYLKTSVRNAARSFFRRRPDRKHDGSDLAQLPAEDSLLSEADQAWVSEWRQCLLHQAMLALEQHQLQNRGNLFHTVLKMSLDYPQDDSPTLAARTAQCTGRPLSAAAYRQQLSRARHRLAQLLVQQVAQSLQQPPPEQVVEELVTLDLMRYVSNFLPADWHTRPEWMNPIEPR